MIWKPHLTVAAVAKQDGRYLLVEEMAGGRRVINQPAGHVEDGESILTAVVRETLEESGWHFEPRGITGIYLWRNDGNGRTTLRVAVHGHCSDHVPERPLDDGILRALWLSPEELHARRDQLRSPLVLKALNDHIAGKHFPLSLLTHVTGEVYPALTDVSHA